MQVARLPHPQGLTPVQVLMPYAIGIPLVHGLSLLACLPWLFSWTGVVLAISGHFLFGMLGMTIGYHRLLTHRGFKCGRWLEYTLATLGVCCLQDTPARWVGIHRKHHQHSDQQEDPHSPLVDFVWGHLGWLFWRNREVSTGDFYAHYARDLLNDPYYLWLEKRLMVWWIFAAHALAFFAIGFLIGWFALADAAAALQFGLSVLVWGVFVRTVLVWHITWAVNSVAHVWGYQNYSTGDNSRNNWIVGLLAHGEGWHNNHHEDQRSAQHGHKWWEFDMSWSVIRLMEMLGLVTEVIRPRSIGRAA